MTLPDLLSDARACRLCAAHLDPRPVLRLAADSRILIIGQAPGSRVHASGVPWDDASGDHLLEWLAVDRDTFRDPHAFGILPMAFCYPGRTASGDRPPPKRCAETWHDALLAHLDPALTLLVGSYAQRRYLGPGTVTAHVRDHARHEAFPLPHPSWRSRIWIRKNPWFETDVLPALRQRVADALRRPPQSPRATRT